MNYSEKLKDPRWQKKRLEVFERDNYECQRCFSEYFLQVHHLRYHRGRDPWEYENEDLIALCDPCHDVTKPNTPKDEIRNPWIVYEREKKQIGILSAIEYQERIFEISNKLSL